MPSYFLFCNNVLGKSNVSHTSKLNEEFFKARVTVGFTILLLKNTIVQLSKAKGTNKVLWVKLVPHGTDAPSNDRFSTTMAHCSLVMMEVKLTVWLTIQFKERTISKTAETILKIEERSLCQSIKIFLRLAYG